MKVFFMMLGAVCVLSSCSNGKSSQAPALSVKTVQTASLVGGDSKEFSFIAQPFRTSELSFRVGGPIKGFDVYAGNRYGKGGLIAQIDPRDFLIRKERSEAVYNQAKAEFERIQTLYEKNNVSASMYEKAKAEYTIAKTAFETAANELKDTKLVAPFNGYVGEVYIEKYQDVKPTQPVLSFIDLDQLKIEIYVTQEIAYAAQSLDSVQIRFDTCPDQTYKARIQEVSKGTTKNNLSYLLTALLPNPDGKLLAGMSGKAVLEIQPTQLSGVSIPQSALCHRPAEGDYVWVVEKGSSQVKRRNVKVGDLLPNGRVAVIEGLDEDETIATSGLRFLSDGMEITVSTKMD